MARAPTIALIVACALLLLVPAGAGAHRLKFPTKVELGDGGPSGAEGKVTSRKASCRNNRLVELFRVDESGGEDQSYGTDRTDRQGNFDVQAPLLAGDYYAKVKKKRVRSHDRPGQHLCRGAESPPVRY